MLIAFLGQQKFDDRSLFKSRSLLLASIFKKNLFCVFPKIPDLLNEAYVCVCVCVCVWVCVCVCVYKMMKNK